MKSYASISVGFELEVANGSASIYNMQSNYMDSEQF